MEIDKNEDTNEGEYESNEEQAHRVFHVLLDAIPDDVCYYNVLAAIYELAGCVTEILHEEAHGGEDGDDDDDDGDISPVGNLPGTSFSKS